MPELWFLRSALRQMLIDINMKFRDDSLRGFQDRQTDGQTDRQTPGGKQCLPTLKGGDIIKT